MKHAGQQLISFYRLLDINDNVVRKYIEDCFWQNSFDSEDLLNLLVERANDRDLWIYDLEETHTHEILNGLYTIMATAMEYY